MAGLTLRRIRRFWAAVYLAMAILTAGCGEDPDPCDPECPPVTENPSGD